MEGKQKTQYRIGIGMSVVLILIAGFFDLLSLIPFVGTVMGTVFWVIAGVYLWTKGVSFFSGRKLAITAISYVAELIPVIQELPMLVAGIIGVLLVLRIEDKTGMSIAKPMKTGITPPKFQRNPLNNEEGIRRPRKDMVEYQQ
ncbi:MAG: hypothetical protein Q7S72_01205 [Candidatus Taylorbacteria bacterium]|nr:hypothetical protein [Candidatus Taylorbacteria bacterium]